jgi:hypothetical protein
MRLSRPATAAHEGLFAGSVTDLAKRLRSEHALTAAPSLRHDGMGRDNEREAMSEIEDDPINVRPPEEEAESDEKAENVRPPEEIAENVRPPE